MKKILKTIIALNCLALIVSCSTLKDWTGIGRNWEKASVRIEAVMVSPLLVYKDSNQVKNQARQIKNSPHLNSVASLVDLQSGRGYIFEGRTSTKLNSKTEKNIEIVLDEGVTPILIVRNDWSARTQSGLIPSADGAKISNIDFYSDAKLEQEKKFLSSLEKYYKYIHIQLNIEPDRRESANFALQMATHLRSKGFSNKIIINPAYSAINAHNSIRSQLDQQSVTWARSSNSSNFGGDPIINTDGNSDINQGNFKSKWLPKLERDGREYIIWSKELANSPVGIPAGYL